MQHDCTCFTPVPAAPECLIHPSCACGCPRKEHAHEGTGECSNGRDADQLELGTAYPRCHGCPEYRPARLVAFGELGDERLDSLSAEQLRIAYRELRAHHIEETTALRGLTSLAPRTRRPRDAASLETANEAGVWYLRMLEQRDIAPDSVCKICTGYGVRLYSSGATWRGGMGTQAFRSDICDQCWGSGNRAKPWLDLRALRERTNEEVAERAVDALARSCGANMTSTKKSIEQIIAHLDALKRKRKLAGRDVDFWMLPLANGLRNILARAINVPEEEWMRC